MHFGWLVQSYPALMRLLIASSARESGPVNLIRYIGVIIPMSCGGCPYLAGTKASRPWAEIHHAAGVTG
jgi:hypothetical protein